jgi:hypothetical protein
MSASITRKAFCGRLMGGSVVLLFQACGGGGGDSSYSPAPSPAPAPGPAPSPGPAPAATCNDTIASNHGHALAVAAADLDSTVDKTYDIHGTADHTHSVTLTVANLQALKAGTTVMAVSSTTFAHEHSVSILCV